MEYGKLLELAREELTPCSSQKLATNLATRPTLLRLQLALAQLFGIKEMPKWLERKLSAHPAEACPPTIHNPESVIPKSAGPTDKEVAFLEGCAMRVLFPNVHAASKDLLARTGHGVTGTDLGCCGALHAHAGMLEEGRQRAESVRGKAQEKTVVTNSAGCGSWLKECGVPTLDLSEAIADLDLSRARWEGSVTYHDACHLAHGQGIRQTPRDLIRAVPGIEFVELAEADLCCGSAGTYNLTQPKMARRLLNRKWGNIEDSGTHAVVLGNPGCHAWIAQAAREYGSPIRVLHLAEFLHEALRCYPPKK